MDIFTDNIQIEDLDNAIRLFKESRTGLLQLFNNSPVCMSMTTTHAEKRVYVRVNKKFLERFRFEEAEVIGRTSVEIGILDEEESGRVGSIIREKGRLQNEYVRCMDKNGDIVHTVSSIERMNINSETYLVSFFVDVTKMMLQQEIIEKKSLELQEVNRELEAFSYSVSHDLRAPLRAIGSYSQILLQDFSKGLDDEGRRMLGIVQRNAIQMGNLIDDLLNLARLGRQAMQASEINMSLLVEEVLVDLKSATNHHAQVRTGNLHAVNGDRTLIKQAITNLLSNAIKYSSKVDSPVVEITSEKENDRITYIVSDNGAGFDAKNATKLFGVFQRLHKSTDFEGTGVGLAIVQQIISRHGGKVYAKSEVGKGASFFFDLPA